MPNIRLSELQKAYALAVKCSESPSTPERERKYFKAIHYQIWKACGHNDQPTLATAADKLLRKSGISG